MNEPALDLDVGHAAPNDLVLTSHEEHHLLTYWRRWRQPGTDCLDRMASHRPCRPVHLRRQQRRGHPGKRLQGDRSPGDHRVDQSSEVGSRYLSLAWASGAASRRLSCVVSALGYEAVGITHSLPSTEHVGTSWWQKRNELRHRGVQDRIEALKALRATRVR